MTKLTTRKCTSPRLTDIQLIVLSHAAQRKDGAATLPDGMTEKAAQKLAATLVRKRSFGKSGRSLTCPSGAAARRGPPIR